MVTINDIKNARKSLKGVVKKTPFSYAPILSRVANAQIFIKKENLQNTGAFKIRGAFNKISSLNEDEKKRGVIASSAGNHAQGVAFSAAHFGLKCYIVMPEATPLLKINGTKELGAEVILHGNSYDEAYSYAKEFAQKHNLTFVHPFIDEKVIAGQGTIALEMLEEVDNLDMIIVPVGGGGLISGIAVAAKAINPNIKIVGVSASGAPAMRNSYLNKKPQDSMSVRTIADGIAVRDTAIETFNYIIHFVDDFVEVDDEEIATAVLFLIEKQKLVVEGAGAVGIAALLHNKIQFNQKERVGVVLSGGNIDVTMISIIIEKGLLKSFRKMKLTVKLIDKPGSLAKLSELFENLRANIVQIDYDRTSKSLDYGDAFVSVSLETKGKEHQEEIKKELLKYNFEFSEE